MAGEMRDQSNRVQAKQRVSHVAVEIGKAKFFGEQITVDVGERGERFVQILLPLVRRRVEHVKQPRQVQTQIRAVRSGAVFKVEPESVTLKKAGVLGKEAKQDANEKAFQGCGRCSRRLPARRAVGREFRRLQC